MSDTQQWEQAYKQLEPKQQEDLKRWLDTQIFIARELGVGLKLWLEYLEWAFTHPFDYSFATEAGAALLQGLGDALGGDQRAAQAANLVGSKRETKLPGKGGPGNLLGMVSAGRKERQKKGYS